MRFRAFAILLACSGLQCLFAGKVIFADGAFLEIPAGLFQNISLLEDTYSRAVIIGYPGATPDTVFAFVARKAGSGPDSDSIFARIFGAEFPKMEPTDHNADTDGPQFFRITSPGKHQGFLFAQKKKVVANRELFFCLVAREADFYAVSPEFWRTSNGYHPASPLVSQNKSRDIAWGMIGLALLLLLANTIIIWMGMKKFGQFKLEIL